MAPVVTLLRTSVVTPSLMGHSRHDRFCAVLIAAGAAASACLRRPQNRHAAGSAHGPWRLSHSRALDVALPKAFFVRLGLPELAAGR